jgi:hypothetical protein
MFARQGDQMTCDLGNSRDSQSPKDILKNGSHYTHHMGAESL